jgi:hypothetical protein
MEIEFKRNCDTKSKIPILFCYTRRYEILLRNPNTRRHEKLIEEETRKDK